MNVLGIKMSLQLMLIFGCDNKRSTISIRPRIEAEINGVLLND